MDNFFRAPEDEHDLTLSLRCGSPKRTTTQSSPSLSPITPPQTNISLMEQLQIPYPNFLVSSSSNHNINPLLVSSSNYNSNPLLVSSFDNNNANLLLGSSSNHNTNPPNANVDVNVSTRRSRRVSSQRRSHGKSEIVPAPFPWATDRRATIHNRKYLLQNNILSITGKVHCRRCEQEFEMELDLEEKVDELRKFIRKERGSMHDRAPASWVNPVLPKCLHCGRANSAKPVLGDTKKRAINWLFLLLGQMLGCCTLDQLKYFCKHTNNHRTGAKDRLLYLTYMTLCKQLVPEWFDS